MVRPVAATDYPLLLFLHQVAREVNELSPHSALWIESPRDTVFDEVPHGTGESSLWSQRGDNLMRDAGLLELREMTPYAALGVNRDAADADFRRRYRELIRQWHPGLRSPGYSHELP